eukprot:1120461-Rhodomonas_salina.1
MPPHLPHLVRRCSTHLFLTLQPQRSRVSRNPTLSLPQNFPQDKERSRRGGKAGGVESKRRVEQGCTRLSGSKSGTLRT